MSDAATLLEQIAGDDEWSRHSALERLRSGGLEGARMEELRDALDDDSDAGRRSAARMALAALASPESPDRQEAHTILRGALRSSHPDLRVLAASALGEAGDPAAVGDLIGALGDEEPNVVAAAADALGILGHAGGIGPLADLATAGEFWIRAAAVVSLGRIRDARAIPALARAAEGAGLEEPVIEALREIGDAEGLPLLGELAERAPEAALLAAGGILCAHPEIEAPDWIARHVPAALDSIRRRFQDDEDPAAARLLGIAAPPGGLELLLDRIAPPYSSEAALTGVLAAPAEPRTEAIFDRLSSADAETRVTLLALLPPLREDARIGALVPLLEDPDAAVRAAAAESLGRAPAGQALPLLREQLERGGASPEVLRAMGGLGTDACLALTPLLADEDAAVRRATADALTRCGGPDIAGQLREALDREKEPAVRASLLRAYGHAAGSAAVDLLGAALGDPALEVRLAAMEGLGSSGDPRALLFLERALEREAPECLAALRAVGDLGDPSGADLLVSSIREPDRDTRRVAAGAAVQLAGGMPPEAIATMAADEDEWVRICAARVLARRHSDPGRLLERLALNDPSPAVRTEARRASGGVE